MTKAPWDECKHVEYDYDGNGFKFCVDCSVVLNDRIDAREYLRGCYEDAVYDASRED